MVRVVRLAYRQDAAEGAGDDAAPVVPRGELVRRVLFPPAESAV